MRADIYLFNFGYAKSRQNAKTLIEAGNVIIDTVKILKPSFDVDESIAHNVEIINKPRFVSRGGEKLAHALDHFKISAVDKLCLDIGASTGGFTDCLLQNGAKRVFAIDSGHSQLDPIIEYDERVISYEKFNARFMTQEDFPFKFDLVVMDVSFISQTLIHPAIAKVINDGGEFISLIKPQFECGKAALNSQGIVKSSKQHAKAICAVIDSATICGLSCIDLTVSPIVGGTGNVEYLAHFKKCEKTQNLVSEAKINSVTRIK